MSVYLEYMLCDHILHWDTLCLVNFISSHIKQSFRFVEYDQEYDKPKFFEECIFLIKYDIILLY